MPLRILHILDSDLNFQTRRVADDLARALGTEMRIEQRMIGGRRDNWGIARAILRFRRLREFDVVHTFGRRALIAAALVMKAPIVHSLSPEAPDTEIRWLRAIRGHRPIRVVVSSDFDRRRIEDAEVIRPGVDFSMIKPRRDPKLREALGFNETDYVILAGGESTRLSRHDLAFWTCGILSELNGAYKILLWSRGPLARQLFRRSVRWRRPEMARFAESALGQAVEYEQLLSTADLVLVTADNGAATLPISLGMAAGLPIVSVVNRSTSELLEDRHTAAMVGTTRARDLARRVLDIRSDAALQWHIADQARAEAYEHFSLSKSIEKWREIYEAMKVGASATLVKPNL